MPIDDRSESLSLDDKIKAEWETFRDQCFGPMNEAKCRALESAFHGGILVGVLLAAQQTKEVEIAVDRWKDAFVRGKTQNKPTQSTN